MGISSDALGSLIEAIAAYPAVLSKSLRFAPTAEARFHKISDDTLTWDWCDRHGQERGLRAALAYYDTDGQIVSVNVAYANDVVTEVELWRGDGQPIRSVPRGTELWEMVEGRIYSRRT